MLKTLLTRTSNTALHMREVIDDAEQYPVNHIS